MKFTITMQIKKYKLKLVPQIFIQPMALLPRKTPTGYNLKRPVPETDTGGKVEYTKGREITLSKELGKMAP